MPISIKTAASALAWRSAPDPTTRHRSGSDAANAWGEKIPSGPRGSTVGPGARTQRKLLTVGSDQHFCAVDPIDRVTEGGRIPRRKQDGAAFAVVALNTFILTTLDTATRITRYITSELFGIQNMFLSTLIVVVVLPDDEGPLIITILKLSSFSIIN